MLRMLISRAYKILSYKAKFCYGLLRDYFDSSNEVSPLYLELAVCEYNLWNIVESLYRVKIF